MMTAGTRMRNTPNAAQRVSGRIRSSAGVVVVVTARYYAYARPP
jgi:hypothetical protein